MDKLSTNQFIEKSNIIHNNKYDYSKVNYTNSRTPVCIICKLHGEFLQIPDNHIHRKSGCKKCCNITRPQNNPKSLQTFIIDANKLHQYKYDYYKSVYKSAKEKIEIICNKHGSFYQTPNSHLNGNGCPSCYGNKAIQLTTDMFIDKANIIHNNIYDYSKSKYVNNCTKVEIICKIHGSFWQETGSHMKGVGCPRCKKSKGELAIENFLQSKNILYETPKSFSSCKNPLTGWKLYFDFYLPKQNILIEFDGYQHFKPYYRDKYNLDSLSKRQERDLIKTNWAKDKRIPLFRIKYTQIRKISFLLSSLLP